mmetsp:Transcript_38624/g.89534  ORF Transcript_38624/g.89534 Transcript_38624/m.89534 type:complete len:117 (+) Transcript_38624:74-424(+)
MDGTPFKLKRIGAMGGRSNALYVEGYLRNVWVRIEPGSDTSSRMERLALAFLPLRFWFWLLLLLLPAAACCCCIQSSDLLVCVFCMAMGICSFGWTFGVELPLVCYVVRSTCHGTS